MNHAADYEDEVIIYPYTRRRARRLYSSIIVTAIGALFLFSENGVPRQEVVVLCAWGVGMIPVIHCVVLMIRQRRRVLYATGNPYAGLVVNKDIEKSPTMYGDVTRITLKYFVDGAFVQTRSAVHPLVWKSTAIGRQMVIRCDPLKPTSWVAVYDAGSKDEADGNSATLGRREWLAW
jgi:hypothetical protein